MLALIGLMGFVTGILDGVLITYGWLTYWRHDRKQPEPKMIKLTDEPSIFDQPAKSRQPAKSQPAKSPTPRSKPKPVEKPKPRHEDPPTVYRPKRALEDKR